MQRRGGTTGCAATGGGRRVRPAGRAMVVAVLLAAAAGPLAAQAPGEVRGRTPTPAAATTARAEMAALRRQESEAAARLERFVATLSRRVLTPALSDSLASLVARHSALRARLATLDGRLRVQAAEMQLRRELAARGQPEGWFGVYVETISTGEARGGAVLRSMEYPRVRSVEPGSPAARAGLLAGDQLIAIDGVDLRRSEFDTRELLPGRTLPVRISRDGQARDLRVTIAPRPRTFVSGVTMRVTTEGQPVPGAIARVRVVEPADARTIAREPRTPRAVPVLGAAPVIFFSSQNGMTVAGAEVLRLSAELRTALDLEVRDGLFVVQVARSTPAERAGLRQGDVLLRAGGVTLVTPLALQRAVAAAADSGAGGIRIELVRAKKTRAVEMRW